MHNKAIEYALDQNYIKSLDLYTQIIKSEPNNFIILKQRSAIYLILKNYENAKKDALSCIKIKPFDCDAHYRLAIAYYHLKSFNNALEAFKKSKLYGKEECDIWFIKCEKEILIRKKCKIKEENNIVNKDYFIPFSTLKTANIQTENLIKYFIYLKNVKKDKVKVVFEKLKISIEIKDNTDKIYKKEDYLYAEIDPFKCHYDVDEYKICVCLIKKESFSWEYVFKEDKVNKDNSTSSFKKNDYDARLCEKEENSEEESKDIVDIFRKIYNSSDENTKRAMNKSMSTSGGTCLSTNWEEVKNIDYSKKCMGKE